MSLYKMFKNRKLFSNFRVNDRHRKKDEKNPYATAS